MFKFIKDWIRKSSGIEEIEKAAKTAAEQREIEEQRIRELLQEKEKAEEDLRIAKLSPKELATEKKVPWVSVLETHINPENPRNGFFELDWNEYFIAYLRDSGYTGGSDEEVVDGWFQELCREIGNEEGIMIDRRFGGYINVNNLGNGKSEVS